MVGFGILNSIGLASAVVLAAMGGTAIKLLWIGKLTAPVLRSLGITVIVVAVATGAAMMPPPVEGMPVIGPGGYLGAMTSLWLLDHFAPLGAWILTLTVMAIGTLLTTDYALLYASRKILAGSTEVSRRACKRPRP